MARMDDYKRFKNTYTKTKLKCLCVGCLLHYNIKILVMDAYKYYTSASSWNGVLLSRLEFIYIKLKNDLWRNEKI